MKSRISFIIGLLLIFLAPISALTQTQALEPMVVGAGQASIVGDAVKRVTPEYPAEAIAAGAQGLVVAVVRFNAQTNDLVKIKVLQSPHPSITEAVIKAVKEWKIGRWPKVDYGKPVHIQSELYFHFILEDGKGRVEGASDDELKADSKLYRDSINASVGLDLDKPFRP